MIFSKNKHLLFFLLSICIVLFAHVSNTELQSNKKELVELFDEPHEQKIVRELPVQSPKVEIAQPVKEAQRVVSPVTIETIQKAEIKKDSFAKVNVPEGKKVLRVNNQELPRKGEPSKKIDSLVMVQTESTKEVKKNIQEVAVQLEERIITVNNNITRDMITYKKHWSGNHTPSKFVISINDEEMALESTKLVKIPSDCETITITFNYEFTALGRVQRSGGKKLAYRVPKDIENIASTFSWDEPQNLILDNVELISSIEM